MVAKSAALTTECSTRTQARQCLWLSLLVAGERVCAGPLSMPRHGGRATCGCSYPSRDQSGGHVTCAAWASHKGTVSSAVERRRLEASAPTGYSVTSSTPLARFVAFPKGAFQMLDLSDQRQSRMDARLRQETGAYFTTVRPDEFQRLLGEGGNAALARRITTQDD